MKRPSEEEIDEVLNACAEQEEKGGSMYPGMTYEQGVEASIMWMMGNGDHPIEDS